MDNTLSKSKHWVWFEALYLFDYGKPERLVQLVSQTAIPKLARKSIAIRLDTSTILNKNRIGQIKTDPGVRLQLLIEIYDRLTSIDVEAKQLIEQSITEHLFVQEEIHAAIRRKRTRLFLTQSKQLYISQKAMRVALNQFLILLREWPYLDNVWTISDYKKYRG